MIKNLETQINDAGVFIDSVSFQPEMRINMTINMSIYYPLGQVEHAEGSVFGNISTYALGKRIIATMQEQLKEKHMNEGN